MSIHTRYTSEGELICITVHSQLKKLKMKNINKLLKQSSEKLLSNSVTIVGEISNKSYENIYVEKSAVKRHLL